jgi:hypothetical protein
LTPNFEGEEVMSFAESEKQTLTLKESKTGDLIWKGDRQLGDDDFVEF